MNSTWAKQCWLWSRQSRHRRKRVENWKWENGDQPWRVRLTPNLTRSCLPEATQCLPGGYELKASGSNVGKRQKQAQHHETVNDERLKRDGPALIRAQGRGGQFAF